MAIRIIIGALVGILVGLGAGFGLGIQFERRQALSLTLNYGLEFSVEKEKSCGTFCERDAKQRS